MFQIISPFIWIVLQISILVISFKILGIVAKKFDNRNILLGGMLIASVFCVSMFLMSLKGISQRESLMDDQKLYNNLLSVIPDNKGYKIDERLYENIIEHNSVCQSGQEMINEHPIAAWFFSGGRIESYEQYMVTIPEGIRLSEENLKEID